MKVSELIEKLNQYDRELPVAVRMDVDGTLGRDTLTDLAGRVYRTTRGLVVIEGTDP